MAYVTIKEETESKLHLIREPTMRAWAILVGMFSQGCITELYISGFQNHFLSSTSLTLIEKLHPIEEAKYLLLFMQ